MPLSRRRCLRLATTQALALSILCASASFASETVTLRVESALSAETRASIEVEKSFDYGAFQVIEVDAASADRLIEAGLATAQDLRLTLGEVTFDPADVSARSLLPDAWRGLDRAGDDLRWVQMSGPVRQEWLDTLSARGLKPVQYIHPQTYIVWGGGEALDGLLSGDRATDFVRATGDFEPGFRVLPRWRALPEDATDVHVYFYRGADVDRQVDAIRSLGGQLQKRSTIDRHLEVAGFKVAGNRLADLARLPGVYTIQTVPTDGGLRGEMSNQINVGNYDNTNLAFPGYRTWLADTGYDGTGVIMANVDGGIFDTHPDLVNRMLPCVGSTCGGSATDTHGTHTAGIMAADGSSGTADSNGFLRGLGVAPNAEMVEQVYFPTFTQAGGMLRLMFQSVDNNAVLSGNSWGPAGTPRGYDGDTRQVDVGVRDTDPMTAGDQGLLYVLSFMNGNGGTSTQGSPDEAKNLFNIGSTKMQNSGGQILDINDLSFNTAHGPALDGRTIPHMVAPGCSVDSTLTSTGYGFNCGTSMASPHVSGAAGLFHEKYRDENSGDEPSPALVKAAFIAVALNLEGFVDADGGTLGKAFDSLLGWGRLDLDAVMNPPTDVVLVDQTHVFDNTGEQWIETFEADDPSQPVRLMLTWTDAPGHGTGGSTPAWNNDLDLIVRVGGQTYRGNVFGSDGLSTTGGSADAINNTEGVFFAPFNSATSLEVEILASDVNSDALPNDGDATDQDFALVCYNCRASDSGQIFSDDFEGGNLSPWSSNQGS
ncbi:MAG: S8 family serine peptidase [Acidobacteriota bacterium]